MTSKFNDPLRDIHSIQRAIQRFGGQSSIQNLAKTFEKQQSLVQMAERLTVELRQNGALEAISHVREQAESIRKIAKLYEANFNLPNIAEQNKLLARYKTSHLNKIALENKTWVSGIEQTVRTMRSAWVDTQNSLNSINGLANLQLIGGTLDKVDSFADKPSSILRAHLGDWRDPITWPKDIFIDYQKRSNFYTKLGFDHALTNFPVEAFEEGLNIANLKSERPALIKTYGELTPNSNDEADECSFVRTNTAHDWLLRIESHIRRFIDVVMTKEYGMDWPRCQGRSKNRPQGGVKVYHYGYA